MGNKAFYSPFTVIVYAENISKLFGLYKAVKLILMWDNVVTMILLESLSIIEIKRCNP